MANTEKIKLAKELIEQFSSRTGLIGNNGDESRRYLWTDAFAVQTLFGLYNFLENITYKESAKKLITLVHQHLGKFHPDDDRTGWISGLPEEEAVNHPTKNGLRIGKKLPERKKDHPVNQRLEWERDGQYFHYNTRWVIALLHAHQETKEDKFAQWAAEMMVASSKFISGEIGNLQMYWKMSTDLSQPLVKSMGAHDPLEGFICTKSILKTVKSNQDELEEGLKKFKSICENMDWQTDDALGIGGLLLNTLRAMELRESGEDSPESGRANKLFKDSINSLERFEKDFDASETSEIRLAFRECGLALGLRALLGMKDHINLSKTQTEALTNYIHLADKIENFWCDESNRQSNTWYNHQDINEVSLAASLTASEYPYAFSGISKV